MTDGATLFPDFEPAPPTDSAKAPPGPACPNATKSKSAAPASINS